MHTNPTSSILAFYLQLEELFLTGAEQPTKQEYVYLLAQEAISVLRTLHAGIPVPAALCVLEARMRTQEDPRTAEELRAMSDKVFGARYDVMSSDEYWDRYQAEKKACVASHLTIFDKVSAERGKGLIAVAAQHCTTANEAQRKAADEYRNAVTMEHLKTIRKAGDAHLLACRLTARRHLQLSSLQEIYS